MSNKRNMGRNMRTARRALEWHFATPGLCDDSGVADFESVPYSVQMAFRAGASAVLLTLPDGRVRRYRAYA